ncbi:hypothetical protein DEO72_LG6g1295 [Vigna unguiculata]|uniref:Uncharacterized protein n=1 Tax=Vigna unguiculata TaxID=3917 RepID=A0A4D6M5E2_VIGUN|nr:hypothetical protein DEO72_LG6g1295 [Vigna unguiculata]
MSTLHGNRRRSPFASTLDRSSSHVVGEEGITISLHRSCTCNNRDSEPPCTLIPHPITGPPLREKTRGNHCDNHLHPHATVAPATINTSRHPPWQFCNNSSESATPQRSSENELAQPPSMAVPLHLHLDRSSDAHRSLSTPRSSNHSAPLATTVPSAPLAGSNRATTAAIAAVQASIASTETLVWRENTLPRISL